MSFDVFPTVVYTAVPLIAKLQKDQPNVFGLFNDKKRNAMRNRKEKIFFCFILELSCTEGHFTLDTKACNGHTSCVLLQGHSELTGKRLVIGLAPSKKKRNRHTIPPNKNYYLSFALYSFHVCTQKVGS